MARTPKEYRRLTRNAASIGTYSSLWLGADHLIIVRSSGYHENYQRLQLADLKGVFLTRTNRRVAWAFFWGAMVALSVLAIVLAMAAHRAPAVSWVFLAVGIVGLIGNHLASQGCRAYVLTGVQTAELPSVLRLKHARRVLRELQPLIATAQADLIVVPPPPPASALLPTDVAPSPAPEASAPPAA